MLSRKFLERVRTERTVDTRKYRYRIGEYNQIPGCWAAVFRKPIIELDTTSDWQVVATYNGYTARWNRCKPQ